MGASPSPFVREMEIFVELEKSHVDKETGRVWVRGIASDNSPDFQADIVAISQVATSLSILNRGWGKFNYDHHAEIIGEITSIAFITPEEALAKYGVVCVGTVLEVEGFVYAVTERTPAASDVREVHKLIDAGAKLGFSVQGGVKRGTPIKGPDGKTYNVAIPTFLNQVAITTQPINMNTICLPFAKSLAALLREGGNCEPGLPPLVFTGESASVDELLKSTAGASGTGGVTGALNSSGGQALVGAEGGDATRTGALRDEDEEDEDDPATEIVLSSELKKSLQQAGAYLAFALSMEATPTHA